MSGGVGVGVGSIWTTSRRPALGSIGIAAGRAVGASGGTGTTICVDFWTMRAEDRLPFSTTTGTDAVIVGGTSPGVSTRPAMSGAGAAGAESSALASDMSRGARRNRPA
jgi:hypothetical protein